MPSLFLLSVTEATLFFININISYWTLARLWWSYCWSNRSFMRVKMNCNIRKWQIFSQLGKPFVEFDIRWWMKKIARTPSKKTSFSCVHLTLKLTHSGHKYYTFCLLLKCRFSVHCLLQILECSHNMITSLNFRF